jgi:MSHA biogenesis protein MshJ
VRAYVERLRERIDGATLRERVLVFAAAALALVAAANLAVLGPLSAKERRVSNQLAQRQQELKTIQTQLQAIARGGDPAEPAMARVRQLRQKLAELDAAIAREQRRFTPPERMRATLEEMLERNRRLALVDFRTLPLAVLDGAAEAVKGAPGAAARRVYRHGVEITVSGAYFDLHAYLRDLEKLPTQLYWGRAELAAGDYPRSTLKLHVYTLSFDRSWLRV